MERLHHLQNLVNEMVQLEYTDGPRRAPKDSTVENVVALLVALEDVFLDNLQKNGGQWNCLKAFSKRELGKEFKGAIMAAEKEESSALQRTQIFVQSLLNTKQLHHLIETLTQDAKLLKQYYKEQAILRREDHVEVLLNSTQTLSLLSFAFREEKVRHVTLLLGGEPSSSSRLWSAGNTASSSSSSSVVELGGQEGVPEDVLGISSAGNLEGSHSVQESHLGSADLVVVHRGRKVGKHSDASKTAGNREKKKKTKKVKKRSSLSPRRPKGRASIEKQCESRHLTRSLSPEPTVELPETPEGGDEALSATHSHPLGVEPQPQWGRGVTASMLDPIVMDATSPGDECATSSSLVAKDPERETPPVLESVDTLPAPESLATSKETPAAAEIAPQALSPPPPLSSQRGDVVKSRKRGPTPVSSSPPPQPQQPYTLQGDVSNLGSGKQGSSWASASSSRGGGASSSSSQQPLKRGEKQQLERHVSTGEVATLRKLMVQLRQSVTRCLRIQGLLLEDTWTFDLSRRVADVEAFALQSLTLRLDNLLERGQSRLPRMRAVVPEGDIPLAARYPEFEDLLERTGIKRLQASFHRERQDFEAYREKELQKLREQRQEAQEEKLRLQRWHDQLAEKQRQQELQELSHFQHPPGVMSLSEGASASTSPPAAGSSSNPAPKSLPCTVSASRSFALPALEVESTSAGHVEHRSLRHMFSSRLVSAGGQILYHYNSDTFQGHVYAMMDSPLPAGRVVRWQMYSRTRATVSPLILKRNEYGLIQCACIGKAVKASKKQEELPFDVDFGSNIVPSNGMESYYIGWFDHREGVIAYRSGAPGMTVYDFGSGLPASSVSFLGKTIQSKRIHQREYSVRYIVEGQSCVPELPDFCVDVVDSVFGLPPILDSMS